MMMKKEEKVGLVLLPLPLFLSIVVVVVWGATLAVAGINFPQLPRESLVTIETGRTGFSAVTNNNSSVVYVIGGFFHINQGGEPIDWVARYNLLNSTTKPANVATTPTKRGFATAFQVNETLVLIIGGSATFAKDEPLTTIESFDLSTMKWSTAWGNLSCPRINPAVTWVDEGILVSLGAGSNCTHSDLIVLESQSVEKLGDVGLECNGSGVSTRLNNSSVILVCQPTPSTITTFLLTGLQWQPIEQLLLTSWTIRSLQSVTSNSSLFVANTTEHNTLIFQYTEGSYVQYNCYTGLVCNGTLLYTEATWICLTSSDDQDDDDDTTPLNESPSNNRTCAGRSTTAWPMFHGNSQHTGQSTASWACYPSFYPSLAHIQPDLDLGLYGAFSPIVDENGTVYVGAMNGTIYAVNGTTMQVLWSHFTNQTFVSSNSAATRDGILYVVGGVINLLALNCTDGSPVWRLPTLLQGESWYSAPMIGDDGNVYVSTLNDLMKVIDPLTGEVIRTVGVGVTITTPAIDSAGTVYVGSSSRPVLFSFTNSSNSIVSISPASFATYSSPAIGIDGTVFHACLDANLYVLRNDRPTEAYQCEGMILSSPALSQYGVVYFLTTYGNMYAITCDTLEVLWESPIAPPGYDYQSSAAIMSDNTVFINAYTQMLAFDGQTGAVKWNLTYSNSLDTNPAIGPDGTVYFVNQGFLVAFNGNLIEQWLSVPVTYSSGITEEEENVV